MSATPPLYLDTLDALDLDHVGFRVSLSAAVPDGRATLHLVLPRSVVIAITHRACKALAAARRPHDLADLAEIERRMRRPETAGAPASGEGGD